MARFTQDQQVIEALRREGGYATLRHLYEIVDFSNWKTKTPEATVRRIVQNSDKVFKIQPGLWALEECRNDATWQEFIKAAAYDERPVPTAEELPAFAQAEYKALRDYMVEQGTLVKDYDDLK